MARKKSAAPKRHADVNVTSASHTTSPPKRAKLGQARRILEKLPTGALILGNINLPWSEVIPPKSLQFRGDEDTMMLSAGDVNLALEPTVVKALSNKQVLLIRGTISDSVLTLHVAVKYLPFEKARVLIEHLYKKDYSNAVCDEILDASAWKQFFRELEGIQQSREAALDTYQHEDLVPILRKYQSNAVGWMLQREHNPADLDLSWLQQVSDQIETPSGENVIYAKYSHVVYPQISSIPTCKGGILADEMGLGKTVVTLALVLNHKRREFPPWQVQKSPNKIQFDDSGESSYNDRELNQEHRLNADEELQTLNGKFKKGVLRSKLNAWYESKLAEMRVNRSSQQRRQRRFKCICGDDPRKVPKNAATCVSCGLMQHSSCCGSTSGETYVCPTCWRLQEPVPSRATLVIAPPAIFAQWMSEINRHTPKLKAMQYNGIKDVFMQPTRLADCDIVVTTYSVLRAELLYVEEPSERKMRNDGRFLRASSTLEKVGWWRVVCDEAQMVESDISAVRQMTNRLEALQRWCVTGTPIQKTVADLYYLTSFMGLGPLDDKNTWNDLLLKPYTAGCKTPLLSVVQQVFWRSTKEQVQNELGIPEQTFESHFLRFTAIEESFYMEEHARSADKFTEGLMKSRLDVARTVASVDKGTLKKLLQPLLNIRQACTHPQVVSGINITSASGAANLGELLTYLHKKTKVECEEALRRHVAALNGLAGLSCLGENWAEAVEHYRSVLRLAEECTGEGAHVDTLQRIHALHNAAELLENNPKCAPPTLRDDNLRRDTAELEKTYLKKAEVAFDSARNLANVASNEVVTVKREFESSPGAWWVPVLMACAQHEDELLDKLEEELHSNDPLHKVASRQFLAKIRSLSGVQVTINKWWLAVEKKHAKVMSSFKNLIDVPCSILVEEALGCHLRVQVEKNVCEMCQMEREMQNLECELFDTTQKEITQREKVLDGALTKGSWRASYTEKTLSTMFSFARGKASLENWSVKDGRLHMRLLELMKKEFKQIRAAWTALNHRVHAEDELTMAKIRLRIASPWEKQQRPSLLALSAPVKTETIHLVPFEEIPQMIRELTIERDLSLSDFKRKEGKLLYLQNLRKDRNATPDPCPVCKNPIEMQWCVLNCGHCFCISCLKMFHKFNSRNVKCPCCRDVSEASDIGFVDTAGSGAVADVPVTGDFSTKVDNIVRSVLKLLKTEPDVKILIFSTWSEVLKILHHALALNNVSFLSLPSGKHQETIKKFRDLKSGVTVLLLPLAWGSKGLNLVEATHVFLVEPILNPAEELQAIGRVHRIGQTRPTVVHRFIINRTVEDKIFSAVSEAKDTWSDKKITLQHLQGLFSIHLV